MLAKPGTMFIAQPDIPVPLAVDFRSPTPVALTETESWEAKRGQYTRLTVPL
jgi:hypothetical protein